MPIKGLTSRKGTRLDPTAGRPIRLGTLQKGERKGFGRNVKLIDHDYFVFRPANGDEALAALFAEAYGEKPDLIPDVRIPASLAGNFDIEECAWLTAAKHTEHGSIFMARSDGENVKQARDPETGKVRFFYDGEMPHQDHTAVDGNGAACFAYGDNLYAWQRSMAVDLILPHLNRLVYNAGVAGHGVVTLITHSVNDIAGLIDEYHAVLDELVSLLANPLRNEQDRVRNYLPLRDFPLRLYRSTDTVTTPNWHKNGRPGERLISTRSLLHWQLAPGVAAAIQEAIDKRTERLIMAVANAPLLPAADPVAQANAELFGDPEPETVGCGSSALPAPAVYDGPDWEEVLGDVVDVEGDYEEGPPPGEDPGEYDWHQQALEAANLDRFSAAAYQLFSAVFEDASKARTAYEYMFGEFDQDLNGAALTAMKVYANAAADGVAKREAVEAARAKFDELVNWLKDEGGSDSAIGVLEGQFEEE